jgi:hypothetical protein
MSEPIWCDVRQHYCRCGDYGKRCDDFNEVAAPQATPSLEVMESGLQDGSRGPAVAAPNGSGDKGSK